ncbi:hypothetical protein ACF1D2_29930 [Streptomyces bacillaris]|uniref:hypothetical protein n=1 Tax=Streptomyces bacillaris TaxID=68179 RepID=UPI003703117A
MAETGALDLSPAAFRSRRRRGAPVATGPDGTMPSDGPPMGADVLVHGSYVPFWTLTPERLAELRSHMAIRLGMRALNSNRIVSGDVGFDLVWRYWKLPHSEQVRMNTFVYTWPFRSIGNLGELVYLRAWQQTVPGPESGSSDS